MESQKWLKQLVVAVFFVSGLILNVGVMKSSAETISKDENIESMEPNNFSIPVVSEEEVESGNMNDGTELPDEFIVNSNDNTNPLLRSATLGTEKWTKESTTREISNGFITWHPDWSEYQYNISFYYFSKSTMSFSASVGYGYFSISVAKAGSSGQAIKADPQKWTRPGVYGNVDVTKYNVKKYNGAGIYTGSTTKYISNASSTYIKSRNK